jgi:protein-disulfide isomerase
LVRSVTVREPEWDEQEAGWMLALAVYEDTRCPICGGDIDECWADGADRLYRVPTPIRCHRYTAAAAARAVYDRNPDVRHPEALIFRAERR